MSSWHQNGTYYDVINSLCCHMGCIMASFWWNLCCSRIYSYTEKLKINTLQNAYFFSYVLVLNIIWYRVLPQRERQFSFPVRVSCVVICPIFSTSKMKAFCIYFYQGNITFKNIINLVSFITNLVEYLVVNSYSVTVLHNFRKETSDSANSILFMRYATASFSFWGIPSTSMVCHLGQRFDEGITLTVWITTFVFTTSLEVRELCRCFAAAWHSLLN